MKYKLSKDGIKQSLYFKSIGDLALALNIPEIKAIELMLANDSYNGWKIEIETLKNKVKENEIELFREYKQIIKII